MVTSIKRQVATLDAALLPNAESILSKLIGSVELKGRELLMLNKERGDKSLGSFKFNIDTGAWADFAAEGMSGHGIVGLVSKYFTLSTQAAITKIRDELGDTYGTQANTRENKRKPRLILKLGRSTRTPLMLKALICRLTVTQT
jgi:hypothetical protein